jgi:uncharacterized membrane protein YbhN (UPF0104 family)
MSRYFKILFYVSFVFLAYYLYRVDYLKLTDLSFSWGYLVISVVFLFFGFFWDAFCWWKVLKVHDINVNMRVALTSHGISIFAKYIPGKAWTILGRATYVAAGRLPMLDTTFISAKAQIVLILVGLLVGSIPYLLIRGFSVLSYVALIIITVILLFLFNKNIQSIFLKILSRILNKRVAAPALSFRKSYQISAYYLLYWFILMIGYFFLAASVLNNRSILLAFALPISTTFGILAIITPGGLGVREGIMVGFLSFFSVPLEEAITFSILARLWFLVGELFIFTLAILLRIRDKRCIIAQKSPGNGQS